MTFSVRAFIDAFSNAPRPLRDQIAPHECDECERVRSDFSSSSSEEMPDDVIIYHADSIPLLSPEAFRYYLPRYVRLTCENRDTNATEFILYNLCPDDPNSEFWTGRCDEFAREECEAIIEYLTHRETWPDAEFDAQWIEPAKIFWRDQSAKRPRKQG